MKTAPLYRVNVSQIKENQPSYMLQLVVLAARGIRHAPRPERLSAESIKALVAERKKEIRREREGVFGAGVGDQQGMPMSQRDRRYQQRKADHSREAQLRR